MNKPQDPEAAETVQTTKVPAVDLPRLVRGAPETDRLRRKNVGKAIWEMHAGKLEMERNELLYHKQHMLAVARAAGFDCITSAIVAARKWAESQSSANAELSDRHED